MCMDVYNFELISHVPLQYCIGALYFCIVICLGSQVLLGKVDWFCIYGVCNRYGQHHTVLASQILHNFKKLITKKCFCNSVL